MPPTEPTGRRCRLVRVLTGRRRRPRVERARGTGARRLEKMRRDDANLYIWDWSTQGTSKVTRGRGRSSLQSATADPIELAH